MELFNPAKDLIWRVVNAVLLIWVLISVTMFINFAVIDNVLKDPMNDYSSYKTSSCMGVKDVPVAEKETMIGDCKANYKRDQRYRDYNNVRNILGSLVSIAISGGSLYLLNRKPSKKKK